MEENELILLSDALDLFGHGTTYTSEEIQQMIKNLPRAVIDEDNLDVAIRSLRAWKELKDSICTINGCECAEIGRTKRCLFEDDVLAVIDEKIAEVVGE